MRRKKMTKKEIKKELAQLILDIQEAGYSLEFAMDRMNKLRWRQRDLEAELARIEHKEKENERTGLI